MSVAAPPGHGKGTMVEEYGNGLRLVRAPNPSPMTFTGTNTWLLGREAVCVIDPGPDLDSHLDAILAATGGRVSHIVVTHGHLDHSALAPRLARETGAPLLGFGGPGAGRSAAMQALAEAGLEGGGEGIDRAFTPDVLVADGDRIDGDGWALDVLHTPGHLGNHVCLRLDDTIFSGDTVMGWASTLISPPDGDLTDFMTSLARLRALAPRRLLPGHGAPVEDALARIDWMIAHRQARETAIVEALARGPATAAGLTARVYSDTPAALLPAAERNVLAHLVDLMGKSRVAAQAPLGPDTVFALT